MTAATDGGGPVAVQGVTGTRWLPRVHGSPAAHPLLRRAVQAVLLTGAMAAVALELVGPAVAVALAVAAVAASRAGAHAVRWPTGRGPSTLTEVPTQRTAPPES